MKATVSELTALAPEQKPVTYTLGASFYVRVQPTGRKVFLTKIRVNGKATMRKIGVFDGTRASIKAAQTEYAKLHASPTPIKPKSPPFEELWEQYFNDHVRYANREATIDEKLRVIGKDIMPYWRDIPVAEISFETVRERHRQILSQGRSRRSADLAISYVRHFFTWAKRNAIIESNPCENFSAIDLDPRERVLRVEELQRLWKATELLAYPHGTFFQMLLLTCQRRSVVAAMRWDQFEREPDGTLYWHIPPGVRGNKAREPFKLCFPQIAKHIHVSIPRNSSDFVFPAKGNEQAPISGFSSMKRKINSVLTANELEPLTDWRVHDFRRTISTTLQRYGVSYEIRQKLLGHRVQSQKGAARHYNFHNYEHECNQALEQWTHYLVENVIHPNSEGSRMLKDLADGRFRRPSSALVHFGR
jgi:integrase